MGERSKWTREVFKPLKKVTAFLLVLALIVTTLSALKITPVSAATLSDEESVQIIKDRIKDNFLVSDTYRVVSGSDIFGYISKSMEYANSIQPNGSWSDVNYADRTNSANGTLWSPYLALYRITAMAMGYNQQGNEAYQNPVIKDAIERALTYWDSVKPSSTNWWENEIGQAMCMGVTGIFMEGIISDQALDICVNYNRGRLDPVGANGVWRTQDYLYKMLVRNNYTEITNGISTLAKTLAVDETGTATEAVQADSSFYCHGAKLYSEGYGMAQFNMVATWVGYTSGTNFAFTEEGLRGLEFYILDGTRWMIRGEFGFLYLGYRRYNTIEGVGSYAADILPGMMVMAQYDTDPERRAKYQKVVDNIKGMSATNGLVGNKHFWRSDYSSHMRDNYGIMTKMSSSRINGGEYRSTFRSSVGNEIYWNAAGTTAIFVNGCEYTDLAPAFDWSHYPGTTAPYEKMPYSLECRFNANSSFVGGVSDGMYGASVFTQDMDSTVARKGYFYFDNEMVALGSGISSTRSAEVHTTINQGIAKENASVDGTLVPKGTVPVTYTNPKWAYNDQIGYVFPENSNVSVSNMDQTASWLNQPAQTKQAFSLYFNHGISPNNASYEYIVVPGKTSTEVEAYSQNIPVQILSNTTNLQAVRNEGLKQTQMIFYNAGSFEYRTGATITVNQPCLAIVDESSGTPKVTVANPDVPGLVVDVKIDQTAGETLYGRYNVGSGIHLGESITQTLTNVPLTANNIIASSFLPGYASFNAVDDSMDTSWRSEPDESQYLVYNLETPNSYVDKVTINWGDNYAKEYIVQYSMDNVNWTDGCLQWNGSGGQEEINLPYVKANYIRILLLSSNNKSGYEVKDFKVNNYVNRALSKATSASGSANSGQVAQYAVDGEGSSRFAANNSATAWWQVNLGQKTPVRTIRISWESTYASTYKLQTSDNGSTWTDVDSQLYTCAKPGWQVLNIPEGSINSQYIRLQCVSRVGTAYGMSFYEFEVFSEADIPAPLPNYGGRTNLAYNKTVTLESYWNGSSVESPKTTTITTDGNYGTKDSTARGTAGSTTRSFYIDMGEAIQVNEVKLYWEVNTADVYLEASDDAVHWTPITHVARQADTGKIDEISFKPVTARYIRVYGVIATKYGLGIYEIEAYGDYSYKLNSHSITLNKGETIDLNAYLSPYAASDVIEFKSYNTDTVTVTTPGTTGTPETGGQATYSASLNAVSGGTSVIIARHFAGSEYDLCTVKVNTYKGDLQTLYDTAVQLDQNDYISSSWSDSNIDDVLVNANTVLSDEASTQRQVDAAKQNLQNSMNILKEKAGKDSLVTVMSQIKALKQADYTPESWQNADFESLLTTADSVYFNDNATQQDINSIIDVLIAAMDGLVKNPSDVTAPSEVTGSTVVAGNGQITVTWTNPTDLDFDHVIVTVTGSAITPQNLGGGVHSATVAGLTNGTTYTIVLQTVDTTGNTSFGVSVNGTPTDLIIPDTTAPSEVTGSAVVAGDGQLTVTWTNPTDLDFDHVIVTVTGSAIAAKNLGGGVHSTTVTGLTNGTTYTIVLQTVDTNGNISIGVSVNGTPTPGSTATPTPKPTATPTPTPVAANSSEDTVSIDLSSSNKEEISFTEKDLQNLLEKTNVDTVKINVKLSDVAYDDKNASPKLILKSEVLNSLVSSRENLTVSFVDQEGKERYSWNFKHDLLAASNSDKKDVDLSLKVSSLNSSDLNNQSQSGESNTGLLVDFGYEGILPSQANVRVYVGDMPGVVPGSKVYLYHVNPKTGKLETLPYSSNYEVDKDGYINFNVIHCSDYAVLYKKAASNEITSLKNQISVTPARKTLYTGVGSLSSTSIAIDLPATLELIGSWKDKTSQPAIGGVIAAYRSGNTKIAKVDKNGKISALGVGSTDIITTVTLYSGKTKTFKTRVTVKEPSITISGKKTLKVGDVTTFTAMTEGVDSKNIIWSTTKKSIVVIDTKTGKATAKSKGIDYVVAKVGTVSVKIKVEVK